MASPQLQRWADSAGLKVMQYVVTAIMVPAFIGYGGKVLDRLERVETLLMRADKEAALFDARLKAIEALVPQRTAELARINEKLVSHELEIQLLKGARK